MAANFETGIVYGNQSWHGGETLRRADDVRRYSVEETIKGADMDWTTTKLPLAIAPGNGDLSGLPAQEVYGVFRTDNWKCLAAVGSDYRCLQNREIFMQFQPFLDQRQLSFETAGALENGKRVYVQALLAHAPINVGNGDAKDFVMPRMLIASSHDQSLATHVGFIPNRVVCDNTLHAAVANKQSRLLRVKHTKGQHDALAAIMQTVDLARTQFVATCEQYKRLAQLPINRSSLEKYVKIVLAMENKDGEISTRLSNQFDRVLHLAIYGKGNPGGMDGMTFWHAYNGVTQWTSHERQKTQEKRNASVWFGASSITNRKALEMALTLAS